MIRDKCGVTGCNNVATHTWSGHPTCDDCATPSRKAGFRRQEEKTEAKKIYLVLYMNEGDGEPIIYKAWLGKENAERCQGEIDGWIVDLDISDD